MATQKLKICSDKAYMPVNGDHCAMLIPYWGKNREDPRDPTSGRFDVLARRGHDFYKMTSIEECNIAVLPVNWEMLGRYKDGYNKARDMINLAARNEKKTAVFYIHDSTAKLPLQNIIVFRTSLCRSTRGKNEYALPAWSEDIISKYYHGKLPLRIKKKKPLIGFCGFAPRRSWKSTLKAFGRVFHNSRCADDIIRYRALQVLNQSDRVQKNFIVRDQFLAGSSAFEGEQKYIHLRKTRKEFINNIIESDYVLCGRGAGNFSYRLYEAMCCGRIPVFIDTDCVLPLEKEIDWKHIMVWIDQKDLPSIAEKVSEFHENLRPVDFIQHQRECRQIWKEYLSSEGFFRNFYLHFK
jgi:hypothetical protein